jgi:hypothetical protein
VAARRSDHRNDTLQRQPSSCDRASLAHGQAIADDSIVVLVAVTTARTIPPAQIAIAQRRS